jgi:hypothetical protein
VREGETGTYYDNSEPDALAEAVARFDPMAVDPAVCVAAARGFGTARFQAAMRAIVAEAVAAERAPRPSDRPAVLTGLLARRSQRAATG